MPSFAHAKTTKQEGQQHTAGEAPIRSRQPGRGGPQAGILALQRSAGNRAVTQLLQSVQLPLQPKLAIGAVNDPLEHEADRVADQVMRMPDPDLSIAAARPHLSRKCAACEEKVEAQKLQNNPAGSAEPAVSAAPPIVHDVLRSPGQPLDQATRAFFEKRFGHDLSQVQTHTNDKAAESARQVGALAYTIESHIVFGAGQHAPNTDKGRRLLAHELTHVVQQAGAQAMVQRQVAPHMTPTTDQDRREFVRDTIVFFKGSAEYFRGPQFPMNKALFERLINNWYLMVIAQERMIDQNLGRDAALKNELRAAYTAAIRVLISRAMIVFNKSENALYSENSGRIPMWAWPTPHRLEPGITTPIAEGRAADVATGNVMFATNGFDVAIVPDGIDPGLGNRAETRINIDWQLPGYHWHVEGGQKKITAFNAPRPVTVRIQTFYGTNVSAASESGYGRGTTLQDIAGGRVTTSSTSLGLHEGSHGLAYVEFLKANPAPQFKGRVGMTEAQFKAAREQWAAELREYSRKIKAFSTRQVDCVGTTIDQFNQARAAAGVAVRIVCMN